MKVQGYDVLEINRLYGNVKDVLTDDYLVSFFAKIDKRNRFGLHQWSYILLRFKEEKERDEIYKKTLQIRDTLLKGLSKELEEVYEKLKKEEKIIEGGRFFD